MPSFRDVPIRRFHSTCDVFPWAAPLSGAPVNEGVVQVVVVGYLEFLNLTERGGREGGREGREGERGEREGRGKESEAEREWERGNMCANLFCCLFSGHIIFIMYNIWNFSTWQREGEWARERKKEQTFVKTSLFWHIKLKFGIHTCRSSQS